jgi:hypothetical protein
MWTSQTGSSRYAVDDGLMRPPARRHRVLVHGSSIVAWSSDHMDLNDIELKHLRTSVDGPVSLPHEPGYDRERVGYNLATPPQPAVIVGATSARDVIAAVKLRR